MSIVTISLLERAVKPCDGVVRCRTARLADDPYVRPERGDREAKAYPVPALWRAGAVQDDFGGIPVLAVYNGASVGVDLYSRRVGRRVLRFRRAGRFLVDRETGSRWSPATGRAVAGPLRDLTLARLPAVTSYWFAWRDFYPRTEIWSNARLRARRR
jgi:hypothetical protein